MGMMGRLTEQDKELIGKAIRGIAENDIGMIQEAVMALGEFKEKPDQSVLYEDYQWIDVEVWGLGYGRDRCCRSDDGSYGSDEGK
mgnify:CR=1 FL=1